MMSFYFRLMKNNMQLYSMRGCVIFILFKYNDHMSKFSEYIDITLHVQYVIIERWDRLEWSLSAVRCWRITQLKFQNLFLKSFFLKTNKWIVSVFWFDDRDRESRFFALHKIHDRWHHHSSHIYDIPMPIVSLSNCRRIYLTQL